MIVEASLTQKTRYFVRGANLLFVTQCVAGSGHQRATVHISWATMSVTIHREATVFKWYFMDAKVPSVCTQNSPHTIISPPPAWIVNTRQDEFIFSYCLRQILSLPSDQQSKNRNTLDQAMSFIVQLWLSTVDVDSVSSYLTGVRPGVAICFKDPRVMLL